MALERGPCTLFAVVGVPQLFAKRDRRNIKNKFTKEERENPAKVGLEVWEGGEGQMSCVDKGESQAKGGGGGAK